MIRSFPALARGRKLSAKASINWSAIICKGWRAGITPNRASRNSGGFPGKVTHTAGASTVARFMSARSFFDSNVLVYTDDKASPAKQRRALDLVAEHRRAGTAVVSLQVLQEYFVTVTRKLHVDVRIARRKVELLAEFDLVVPD